MTRAFTSKTALVLAAVLVATALAAAVSVTVPQSAQAARLGLNVGGGAGSPGVHAEFPLGERTAATFTAGLNRLYSGYYLQAGGKLYLRPGGTGPYAHVAGTVGSGETAQAAWQTGEVGLAIGYAWRLSDRYLINFELGYAVGDGASHAAGDTIPLSYSSSGRVIAGWRLLFQR